MKKHLLTFWMVKGDPKSMPPCTRNPHGEFSNRAILISTFCEAILCCLQILLSCFFTIKDFDSTLLANKNVHYSQKLFWNKKIIPILLLWVFLFPSSNWSAKNISIIILGTFVNHYFVANSCKKITTAKKSVQEDLIVLRVVCL